MDASITGLLLLGVLIVLNAILKMAHVALINASKARLKELAEEEHHRPAERALKLSSDATRLLTSQQLSDLLLRFSIALLAAVALVPPLRDALTDTSLNASLADVLAYGGVMLGSVLLTLVFGEMLPSRIALGYAESIAMRSAGLVNLLASVFEPLLRALQSISGLLAAPFVSGGRNAALVTEEEIMLLVDAGSEGGSIETEEKEMIYSILQFGDTLAREVMVPRIDMVALDIETPLGEALNTIVQAGHSRIPVYEDSIDHVRGLLYAKDLLTLLRDNQMQRPLKELLRPAYFVPESKKAGELLQELQKSNIHLAVVVDEYGGTAGLVTVEDLIEEIVGEIRDEYDTNEEESYKQLAEREYICDAGIDLDDLNRLLDVRLPTDESDTLGGYVFSQLGKVPEEGEQLETEDLHLEVISVNDRRIRKIRVLRKPDEEDATSEEPGEPAPEAATADWKDTARQSGTALGGALLMVLARLLLRERL